MKNNMCLCLILTFFLCLLTSCGDTLNSKTGKQKSLSEIPLETDKDRINFINALINKGSYVLALSYLDIFIKNNPQVEDYIFLKGVALSSEGRLNIYSLFPVLDLYFFHLPISDWQFLNFERNPYTKFLKRYSSFNISEYEGSPASLLLMSLSDDKEIKYYLKLYSMKSDEALKSFQENGRKGDDDLIKLKESQIETTVDKSKMNSQIILLFMNTLWTLYEAIPIVSLLPSIGEAGVKRIEEAYETLYSHPFSDKYKFNAALIKSLGGGLLLVNHIKELFDIDKERLTLIDFVCSLNIEKLYISYPQIRYHSYITAQSMMEVILLKYPNVQSDCQLNNKDNKKTTQKLEKDKNIEGLFCTLKTYLENIEALPPHLDVLMNANELIEKRERFCEKFKIFSI